MTGHLHILFAPLLPFVMLELMGCCSIAADCLCTLSPRAWCGDTCGCVCLAASRTRQPVPDRGTARAAERYRAHCRDESASMQIRDRAEQAAKALDAITKKLSAFSDLDVETVHVKGDSETDLFHALAPKLSAIPHDRLAGIIVLTDGQVHDKPDAALSAPFHALIAGHHDEIDRRIMVKEAPAYGIVGKKVTLMLRVEDQPKKQSDKANVTFTLDDGSRQTILVPVGVDVPFDAPVTHPGQNLFAFETDALPNELTTINNSVAVTVNGIRDRLRVLLVSGAPHIGGRTWRNFLKTDPAVDLIHFTILRSPMKENFVPNSELSLIAFPTNELFDTKLKSFDLVIFDRFSNRTLIPDEYLENIARYVENGGALLISNATDEALPVFSTSPLARILPAETTGKLLTGSFVPDLTEAGRRHPVTSTLTLDAPRNTWGPWFRQIDAQVKNGDVLMTGLNNQPLVVLGHAGQGRVAQFLSDQFWLWARGYGGGGPQAELLRRVAHWLVQEPQLDETALHAQAALVDGQWQLTVTKQSLHDDNANVTLIDPDDRPVQVKLSAGDQPGILTSTMPVKQTGLYHVKDDSQEILAMVGPMDAPEFGEMIASEEKLSPVVKDSGGIAWLADHPEGVELRRTDVGASQAGWNWMGLRKNGQYRVTGSKAYPLWPVWAALAALLAVMMFAWRREGK